MFEQFTEFSGGRCAGYRAFTGLDDNNIAYLTGHRELCYRIREVLDVSQSLQQGHQRLRHHRDFHTKTTRPRRLPPASR